MSEFRTVCPDCGWEGSATAREAAHFKSWELDQQLGELLSERQIAALAANVVRRLSGEGEL